jgi:hypothetical protein
MLWSEINPKWSTIPTEIRMPLPRHTALVSERSEGSSTCDLSQLTLLGFCIILPCFTGVAVGRINAATTRFFSVCQTLGMTIIRISSIGGVEHTTSFKQACIVLGWWRRGRRCSQATGITIVTTASSLDIFGVLFEVADILLPYPAHAF